MTNELNLKIQEMAREYFNEFKETSVDAEWSATAYDDLGDLKSEIDWTEFHYALHTEVIQESEIQATWMDAWDAGKIDVLIQMGRQETERRK